MKTHGKVIFSWDNDILYVEAFGPFNEEGIIDAANKYLNMIVSRKSSSFSVIEIWDPESLASPQAMKEIGSLWSKLKENNCVALALVVSKKIQNWSAGNMLPDIGKIFNKKEDAQKWVKSHGH